MSNNKAFTVTINNKTYQIKEERKLLNQLLVVSRARPDLDLPTELAKYEFSVTPPSIFASDGTLNQEKKKSDITVQLQNYQQPREEQEDIQMSDARKVIFDAMAIVNKIDIKKSGIKNFLEFASNFMDIIDKQASGFQEVSVIFDRYETDSLKNVTGKDCTKQFNPVHYKVTDSTRIAYVDTKEFLAFIQTKSELTKYLSEKLVQQLKVDSVINHHRYLITNIADLDPSLRKNSHEEADTGFVLNALDVSKRDPFTDLVISYSDTSVLLTLIDYYEQLISSIVFKTTVHSYFVGEIYENLSPSIRHTLLEFDVFIGCDQTGKFSGFGKPSCWTTLMNSSKKVLEAFQELGLPDDPNNSLLNA